MTPSEIRAKETKELLKILSEKERELFDLKLKLNTGELAKTASIRKTKRDRSRLLTILREKELGKGHGAKTKK